MTKHLVGAENPFQVDLLKCVHDGAPQVKLASLSSGDIFGESAMIQGGSRSATVRCATQVQVRQSKYAEPECVDDGRQLSFHHAVLDVREWQNPSLSGTN